MADCIIRNVYEAGADHVFMISGRGILYLTDAVARHPSMKHICTYHEQGASYAAMAYSACKDDIAVCLVSTGCAAANAVTACLCAYQDNLPVIFISGNNHLKENVRNTCAPIRTYGSQETDIISMVESVTKYSVMLDSADYAEEEIVKAIDIAREGRRGPVWIDIPLDVQNMRVEISEVESEICGMNKDYSSMLSDIESIAVDMNGYDRPVILIGGGARSAHEHIRRITTKSRIPVVFTPAACDVYGAANESSFGAIGSLGGSRTGNMVVQNADYVLAVGTRLATQETGEREQFAKSAKIVVVDIDPDEHKKDMTHIDKLICMDSKDFFSMLSECNIQPADSEWINTCKNWKELFAVGNEGFVRKLNADNQLDIYSFSDLLSKNLPNNATVITDAGFEELIIPSAIRYGGEQRCLFPHTQGAMGYALPAIIGAHYAGRENIICIVGDGSFMMNVQELLTIRNHGVPVCIFVINNNMYSVIRKRQKDLFKNRTIGNDPSDGVGSPDFNGIADAFGYEYTNVSGLRGIQEAISGLMIMDVPRIVEVMCVPDQDYLHQSYRIDEKKRLIRTSLEDLSPFLDKELIDKEMLV